MIFLLLLCLVLAAVLAGAWYAYRKAFYSPKKGRDYLHAPRGQEQYRDDMERIFLALADRPFETVSIRSFDGLALAGRYYPCADGVPLSICFHGYRSCPMTDLCCYSEIAKHNLLLVDQRAHGDSGGRTISFGIRERLDVLSWISYAQERFGDGQVMFLYGISMGAATVLMASEFALPETVKAIVADCPYSSPRRIIELVGEKMCCPKGLIWPMAVLGARIYGGFDLNETDPVRAVKNADIPILLIHGEADSFVPCEMSGEIREANPSIIELHTFPGAGHGLSYLSDPSGYQKIVGDFLRRTGQSE